MANCTMDQSRAGSCRDSQAAWHLQLIAIAVILITSVVGISLPIMLAQIFQGKPTYNKIVLLIKCFAAGVILSTSLVHVLPDAFEALSDCQVASRHPWKDFPFSGFIAMIGALVALLVDIAASSHAAGDSHYTPIGSDDASSVESKKAEAGLVSTVMIECHDSQRADELVKLKQRLVSQVLEIGIIFHSVIIGVTLGMSQNKCTIRPLVAALAFHQIFEGMGLGGCIAQVNFRIFYLLVGHIGCVRGIQTVVHLLCFAVDGISTGEIMVDPFLLEDFLPPYNCNLHKSSNPVSGLDGLS